MRKHSKVELSVDFTELMTQSFIFNSQVGVLNVKRCKIQNKEFNDIMKTDPIKYLLEKNRAILKFYFLKGDEDEKQYLVKSEPDNEAVSSLSLDSNSVLDIEGIEEYLITDPDAGAILDEMVEELISKPIYLEK